MDYYRIALQPGLGVDAAGFVAAWNGDPECRAAGGATLAEPTRHAFDPGALSEAVMLGVGTGLVANVLYGLIDGALARRGVRRRTRIVQLDQPDGTHLLVVTLDEE